jgi:vitamin B12 transporter
MKIIHYTLGLALAASMQGPFNPASAEEIYLDDVLVIAGRDPVNTSEVGRAHTVIEGAQLERSQVRYVADALRQVPGISVSRTGTTGGFTQVRIRGAEGNHVLVLIDGIEVSEVSQGEFDFGSLVAANIERIEVLRGPQSALWGSNALAGVINIITKPGSRDGFEAGIRTEGGTDGTAIVAANISGGGDAYDVSVSSVFARNDGFNISDFGSEDDGSENVTLNAKTNIDVTENFRLDATARYVNRDTESDRQDFSFPFGPTQGLVIDTNDVSEDHEFSGGIGATLDSFGGMLTQTARFEYSDSKRENFRNNLLSSASEGSRSHVSYQATVRFETPGLANASHSLTGAIEHEEEKFRQLPPVFNPSQLQEQSRSILGTIAEYRGEFFDALSIAAAVRHDENDKFENVTTYSVSGSLNVAATGTRLHSSVGTGATNPTFFEQFGFVPATFTGNPNLMPEESFAWDAGVEQTFLDGQIVVDVTYFNERLTNEITTSFNLGGTTPVNLIGTSPREGVEVSVVFEVIENLTVRGSYTYLSAHEPNGLVEIRRPHHSGSLGLDYAFAGGRGNAFLDATFNGEMEDLEFIFSTPQTRVMLDSYTVVNAGASFWVTDNAQVFGRVENLFDEQYEEVFGFNTKGITGFLGLRINFGNRSGAS